MAKKKILDLSMLTHYSNKLKEYIVSKISEVSNRVDEVDKKIDDSNADLEIKIENNSKSIQVNTGDISDLGSKYTELEDAIKNIDVSCDGHPNGDTININSIEQYTFRNVKAGDVIDIPNTTGNNDFIIECFADMAVNNTVDHKVILLDSNNRGNFICDERYVDVTPDGLKPKNKVTLNYTGETIEMGNDVFEIYTSDIIGEDIIDRIQDIIKVEES